MQVQLGEQIDSKSLLGSYCCTETPGQFVWRPGPLTTAVTTGQVSVTSTTTVNVSQVML